MREGGGEPVGPRLYGEGPLVEVLVAQQEGAAEDVVAHARVVLEAVGRLLEHADLADHVGDLENNKGGKIISKITRALLLLINSRKKGK